MSHAVAHADSAVDAGVPPVRNVGVAPVVRGEHAGASRLSGELGVSASSGHAAVAEGVYRAAVWSGVAHAGRRGVALRNVVARVDVPVAGGDAVTASGVSASLVSGVVQCASGTRAPGDEQEEPPSSSCCAVEVRSAGTDHAAGYRDGPHGLEPGVPSVVVRILGRVSPSVVVPTPGQVSAPEPRLAAEGAVRPGVPVALELPVPAYVVAARESRCA
jgi:hypothetical protein